MQTFPPTLGKNASRLACWSLAPVAVMLDDAGLVSGLLRPYHITQQVCPCLPAMPPVGEGQAHIKQGYGWG